MQRVHVIGVIGQGYVGKNYADALEDRGHQVIRYALEPEYVGNKHKIKDADLAIIAVPTPSVDGVFIDTHVRDALTICREGQIVVIKSTVQKGKTNELQRDHPHLVIIHSPEFLRESFAREDVERPTRSVFGIPVDSERHRQAAKFAEEIFPKHEGTHVMHVSAVDAEFIKYTHNTMGMMMVVYTNVLYDLASAHGVNWDSVKDAILHNPWFPEKYLDPVHKHGRGAGGHCFIKDFAAMLESYQQHVGDKEGVELLQAIARKNAKLLIDSGKDLDILREVYKEGW